MNKTPNKMPITQTHNAPDDGYEIGYEAGKIAGYEVIAFGVRTDAAVSDSRNVELEKLRALVKEAPKFFAPQHDFDGEKLEWLKRAGLA